jgi:hypothetical protein
MYTTGKNKKNKDYPTTPRPLPGLGPNSVSKYTADEILKKINKTCNKLSPQGKIAKPKTMISGIMKISPRKGKPEREISKEQVCSVMHMQQDHAAEKLDISVSVLKKAIKEFELGKWPRKSELWSSARKSEAFFSAPDKYIKLAQKFLRIDDEIQKINSVSTGM